MKQVEKGNVYILSMWCEKYDSKIKTYLSGVHTIAIKCTSKNKLKIYNMYNTDIATLSATSFENMFSKYDGRLICAYKLK